MYFGSPWFIESYITWNDGDIDEREKERSVWFIWRFIMTFSIALIVKYLYCRIKIKAFLFSLYTHFRICVEKKSFIHYQKYLDYSRQKFEFFSQEIIKILPLVKTYSERLIVINLFPSIYRLFLFIFLLIFITNLFQFFFSSLIFPLLLFSWAWFIFIASVVFWGSWVFSACYALVYYSLIACRFS